MRGLRANVRIARRNIASSLNPALTGLRFFAAAFILIEHSADWLARFTDSNVNRYFIFLGMYGMPLFFVLSGFVIHYNYRKLFLTRSIAQATCEFAAARFARLFPLYFSYELSPLCLSPPESGGKVIISCLER